MATRLGVASVRFEGDTKQIDGALKGISGGIKGLGRLIARLAPIIGLAAIGRSIVTNSVQSQRQMGQLGAVIRSTGGAAGKTVGQLDAMAKALQNTTTFGDEATKGVQGLLLTFTQIKGGVFDQATEAVLDMATALAAAGGGEVDLKSASIQVGKALNDPIKGVTALQRVGVSFTKNQRDLIKSLVDTGKVAEAQSVILKELQTEFGGSAKVARTELGGALAYLKNQWGDLFEVSKKGSSGIISAINAMGDAVPKIRAFVDVITLRDLKLVAIAATMVLFGKIVVSLSAAITALTAATVAMNVAWLAGPLGILAAAGLALGFGLLAGKIAAARRELNAFHAEAVSTTDVNVDLLRSLRPDLYAKLPAAMRGEGGGGPGESDEAFKERIDDLERGLDGKGGLALPGRRPLNEFLPAETRKRIADSLIPSGLHPQRRTAADITAGRTRILPDAPDLGPWTARQDDRRGDGSAVRAGRGSGMFGGSRPAPSRTSEILGDVGSKLKSMAGAVGNVLSALNPWGLILEAVQRALGDFLVSMTPIIEVLARALMPILKALFPVFKMLVIAATYVGEVFFTIAGGVAKAMGWLIRAIGKAIDKLPFISGKSIIDAGQKMMDLGQGFTDSAKELGKARDEIKGMEWQDATDGVNQLGAAAAETAAALRNVPAGVKTNLLRFRATDAGRSTHSTATAGSAAGGITVTGPITVTGVQNPREFYDEMEREARRRASRGGTTAFALTY